MWVGVGWGVGEGWLGHKHSMPPASAPPLTCTEPDTPTPPSPGEDAYVLDPEDKITCGRRGQTDMDSSSSSRRGGASPLGACWKPGVSINDPAAPLRATLGALGAAARKLQAGGAASGAVGDDDMMGYIMYNDADPEVRHALQPRYNAVARAAGCTCVIVAVAMGRGGRRVCMCVCVQCPMALNPPDRFIWVYGKEGGGFHPAPPLGTHREPCPPQAPSLPPGPQTLGPSSPLR